MAVLNEDTKAIAQAMKALKFAVDDGQASQHVVVALAKELLRHERLSWDARCHFCAGPSYPWIIDDELWTKVEPVLGQQQACFECFSAAWQIMGLSNGDPFEITLI
jgi:hypothetical protein